MPVSRDLYFAFVQQMRSGGLVEVFDQYPVLARLLAQSVDQWVSAVARFCRRFESDWPRLVKLFDWPHETSDAVIELVKSGLSDRHGGGQTVVEVVLAGGERLIYKPRSVRAEIVFNDLLRWLNERGLPLELKTLRGLDRRRYGWMEVGHHGSCRTQAEVERFCIRAGMLLAILHALAVTDIHCENLIACAEHPVVVDLETLLTESPRRPRGSVLDTGFLPRERAGEPDLSALAADPTPRTGLRFPIWRRINTDQMMLEEGAPAETHLHRVRLNGEAVAPTEYLGSIHSGFRMAYTALMQHRRDLLRAELMAAFDGLELRVLLRDSATYGQMHLHMLHPEYLKDGIDRSIELEWLARPLCSRNRPAVGRLRIYQHELNAMEQLDVPRFDTTVWHNMRHARTSSEALLFGGARDSSVLRRRLARLRASGCLVQLAVISRSLLSHCA